MSDRPINPRQLRFVREYVSGEYCGNAMRAYMKAYGVTNEESAAASASYLLTTPNVVREIEAFRDVLRDEAVEEMKPWIDLAPEAQRTLLEIARGEVTSGAHVRLAACREILDRALGKPKESVEVSGRTQVDAAVAAFLLRVGQRQREKVN